MQESSFHTSVAPDQIETSAFREQSTTLLLRSRHAERPRRVCSDDERPSRSGRHDQSACHVHRKDIRSMSASAEGTILSITINMTSDYVRYHTPLLFILNYILL